MRSVIPTTIIIVGLMIMMCCSTALIAFEIQVSEARSFHQECVSRIQASYYNPDIIADCQSRAYDAYGSLPTDSDYDPNYDSPEEVLQVNVEGFSIYDERTTVPITLNYKAELLFFNLEKRGTISLIGK